MDTMSSRTGDCLHKTLKRVVAKDVILERTEMNLSNACLFLVKIHKLECVFESLLHIKKKNDGFVCFLSEKYWSIRAGERGRGFIGVTKKTKIIYSC